MYDHIFIISVFCYKSHYKRAKNALFSLYHYNATVTRQQEIDKIVNLLANIVPQYKRWKSNELNIRFHLSFKRKEVYTNADNKDYEQDVSIYQHSDRHTYYSIEGFIRDILNTMKIADPTILLSEKELFENPSSKTMIRLWYRDYEV